MRKVLPDGEFTNKMYTMGQENHPERIFALDRVGKTPGEVIYDMGCGEHKSIPNAIGVDIRPVTDILGSIDDLPMIKSNTADFIISRHSFEHLLDPIKVLHEWTRILRPGGSIIFVLPDHDAFDTLHPGISARQHFHAYTKETLPRLLLNSSSFLRVDEVCDVVPDWSFGVVATYYGVSSLSPNPMVEMERKIDKSDNFSFIKCGDGEMLAMIETTKGANCDGQSYSPELARALKNAYISLGKNHDVKITRWKLPGMEERIESFEKELNIKMTEDHDLLMNRVGEIKHEHYNFWKTIKESKRRKIFVGPERLSGVIDFLNIDQMKIVPQSNAFEKEWVKDIKPERNDIFIFSAGMAAKVWMAQLLELNPHITCIDAGSAFDPIFVGGTRTNQLPQSYLKEFYKDLLN